MNKLDDLIEEVGAEQVRPLTQDRVDSLKESNFREYDEDADTTMTFEQARKLATYAEGDVSPVVYNGPDEFFELWEQVVEDWPKVEVKFTGKIAAHSYIDAVYLAYDDIDEEKVDEFKEYCVLRFKCSMDRDTEENAGICPYCDERITLSSELFRTTDSDSYLLAEPSEFDFFTYPELGDCVRLWWD